MTSEPHLGISDCTDSEYPQLRVMRRQHERGFQRSSPGAGVRGNVLGRIDGDLQHPPHVLQLLTPLMRWIYTAMWKAAASVAELCQAVLSRGAQLIGLVLPVWVSDPMSGYFMVRRTCIAGSVLNPVDTKF